MKNHPFLAKSPLTQILAAAAILASLGVTQSLYAANGTWTNLSAGDASGTWSVSGNWNGGTVADGAGFGASFATLNITGDSTIHLDSARTLGGGVLTLNFGDTNTSTAAGWTLDNNGNAANVLTLGTGVSQINVGALGVGKAATISLSLAGDSLRKTGAGTLILTGANTYIGQTLVGTSSGLDSGAGVLQVSGAGTLGNGSSNTTVLAGVLDLNGTTQSIGTLTGGGGAATSTPTVTIGSGVLNLGGNVTYSAGAGGNQNLGFTVSGVGGGVLNLNNATRTFSVGDSTNAAADMTVSASIANGSVTSGLSKTGAGVLLLTGANTYTGATSVSVGTLLVGNGTSGSITSAVTVTAGSFYGNLTTGNITTQAVTVGNSAGGSDSFFGAGQAVLGRFASASTLTLNSDSTFVFDLNSTSELTDVASFGGTVTLNGVITFNDLGGISNWTNGDMFTVVSGLSVGGTFANLADNAIVVVNGVSYQADYTATALTMTVVPEPSAMALLALGGTALMAFRRRRQS